MDVQVFSLSGTVGGIENRIKRWLRNNVVDIKHTTSGDGVIIIFYEEGEELKK